MHCIKKIVYNTLKNIIKLYLKIFFEFKVWGKENISSGPYIFCSNHFSSTDPFFVITLMNEPVHMVIGPGFKVPIFKQILKIEEQINALRENRINVIANAIRYLSRGESIYIFPEGNLDNQDQLLKFYNGISKIHVLSKCPIVPIGIASPKRYVKEKKITIKIGKIEYKTFTVLTGKYYVNIGKPLIFYDEKYKIKDITEIIKMKIKKLIEDVKTNKFWS